MALLLPFILKAEIGITLSTAKINSDIATAAIFPIWEEVIEKLILLLDGSMSEPEEAMNTPLLIVSIPAKRLLFYPLPRIGAKFYTTETKQDLFTISILAPSHLRRRTQNPFLSMFPVINNMTPDGPALKLAPAAEQLEQ